ncbi:histidine phosphatase family protein [Nonomuraea terrae]|uniref:histidine phosphatase family protein n=1 Tax=Nonomuraea terrae TaxID=2530383 RepID=UPI0037A8AE8D
MLIPDVTLELVPHCESVPRQGWEGDHDARPLSGLGRRQAEALVPAVGLPVDAIFSSPARRCRETVEPLARATGLPVECLETLAEADGFREPAEWVGGVYAPVAGAIGGAWSAGRMAYALTSMARRHPGGRVVASSHGDVIPALLAMLSGYAGTPLPDVVERGGRYTLRFDGGTVTLTSHQPVS